MRWDASGFWNWPGFRRTVTEMRFLTTVLLVLLMATYGCHPHGLIKTKADMCPVQECQKDDMAIIKGDGYWIPWLLVVWTTSLAGINAVDGNAVKPDQASSSIKYYWSCCDVDEVRVPSGPHQVVVRISKWVAVYDPMPPLYGVGSGERLTGYSFLTFRFDTKAGHTYRVDIPAYWKKGSVIKIIDHQTKEEVASQVVDWYIEF